MNPRWRKGTLKLVRLFVVLTTALLVSTGGYAQVHAFPSHSSGRSGRGSAGFHGSAVGHWGVQQHGFAYGGGHVSSGWVSGWGHGQFGYSPYYGGLHSRGPGYYPYPLHRYPLYGYPRGHRPRYYFRRYHRPRYYGGWHSQGYYNGRH